MQHKNQLPIPEPALKDQDSRELIRLWIADGGQQVSLATDVWEDPAAWGIALVDLARHVARAYQDSNKMSTKDALTRLREGFDAEWSNPTDEPKGAILK